MKVYLTQTENLMKQNSAIGNRSPVFSPVKQSDKENNPLPPKLRIKKKAPIAYNNNLINNLRV